MVAEDRVPTRVGVGGRVEGPNRSPGVWGSGGVRARRQLKRVPVMMS